MKTICIFGVSNGVGISRDIEIIKRVLSENPDYAIDIQNPFKANRKTYDMCIFLERFSDTVLDLSPINIFIPNPEWFEPGWTPALKSFVAVFAKTKIAYDIFKAIGCHVEMLNFTSEDRYLPEVEKDYYHWFHLAGKSIQKQTEVIWKTWEKNPGFPNLTILQDPKFFKPRPVLRNVNYMYDRISDYLLKQIQNNFGVHVCPSLTEGFGHYIVEALSCKSVVITTNGSPMNEMINTNNGVLVNPFKQEKMRLSIANVVNVENLEKAVIQTMVMDDMKKQELGENARKFFLQNDNVFKNNLLELSKKYLY